MRDLLLAWRFSGNRSQQDRLSRGNFRTGSVKKSAKTSKGVVDENILHQLKSIASTRSRTFLVVLHNQRVKFTSFFFSSGTRFAPSFKHR
jgi:hypothetical protein